MDSDKFFIEYAASSRSACKKCKLKLEKGVLRIGKLVANPFHEGDTMKSWYHAPCMFESLQRARATTKKIEKTEELEGFDLISDDDKDKVKKMIEDLTTIIKSKPQTKKKKAVHATLAAHQGTVNLKVVASDVATSLAASADTISTADDDEMKTQDNSFYRFSQLCGDIEAEASYKAKTEIVATYIKQGSSGDGFKGDLYLLVKLLLPGAVKRVYNLQNKQLLKLFSKIFGCDQDDMTEDMEQSGDVSDTVMKFFEESSSVTPVKRSTLSLVEVDQLLESLSGVTKEEEQEAVLRRITQRSTAKDIKYIVRLIKGDLRMNARSRHILDALDPNAYAAFQTSNDLQAVVDRLLTRQQSASSEGIPSLTRTLSVKVSLMTPVKPMLAEACKSVGMAMKKCPDGMYAEIKYDGERVQIHKKGNQYSFFSRTLKPVLKHKVEHVKDYLPQACPHGNSIILDSEVLLVDTKTGNPLPFGTLGIHKKSAFQDATVCLFVFDCLLFNDESLLDKTMLERRRILEQNLTEIPNRIVLSEQHLIKKEADLSVLMTKVMREGLEGLVLKDVKGVYEPNKRHWLKMKKDYLHGGAMADTADLVVLGAYYGTGNNGGLMSVFLMGVYDKACDQWKTVCKCGNGHTDATIQTLQTELKMVKIGKDSSKVPSWLLVNKSLTPDFVSADPKHSPVWEITGAEFSESTSHTASNISIRFPRVTRVRDDKDWTTATNMDELKMLVSRSKQSSSFPDVVERETDNLGGIVDDDDEQDIADQAPKMPLKRKRLGVTSKSYQSQGKKARKAGDCSDDDDDDTLNQDITKKGPGPSKKKTQKGTSKSQTKKPTIELPEKDLPRVFSGMKFYIPDGHSELSRYIIAFDGDVAEEYNRSTATHVVQTGKNDDEGEGEPLAGQEIVLVDWLWKCITKRRLLPR